MIGPRPRDCPGSVDHEHSEPTRHGRCQWCRRRIAGPMPRPTQWVNAGPSALLCAYRRMWDPDWGSAAYDDDPW